MGYGMVAVIMSLLVFAVVVIWFLVIIAVAFGGDDND